ncbi:TRAP transporter small permease subunit [Gammaproteobacteria bacterium]|nr:TRAP transporter small permease subunit [Gammaproteobacteria bacterium]MDC0440189.1 TRAP transporter small permease subunit [Gammaproteobacteria bacterium]
MSDYLGRFFARLIPVLLILVMIVVIGRYFFGIGRVDIQELALYVHALIFLGCAGWAYSADEHVRVDIFYRNASSEYKKAVNTFGIVFFLMPMIGVLGYYAIDFVLASWSVREISTEPGGLSIVYIQKSFIFLFPFVLALAGIRELYRSWK